MKRKCDFLLFIIITVILMAIHLKFTKYEWQHLMLKPLPWTYWTNMVFESPKYNYTESQFDSTRFNKDIGVVFLVYPKSLLLCYTAINFLKLYSSVNYPIEIWYHSQETSRELLTIFDNVYLMDIKNYNISINSELDHQYHLKSTAMLYSTFKKVIYIDTDALILSDISKIINQTNKTVIAAKDFWFTPKSNPIYSILNITPKNDWDMEAGFMYVDKSDMNTLKSLQLANDLNINHHIFNNYIHGDKDTFNVAFNKYNVAIDWLDSPGIMTPNFYSSRALGMAHFYQNDLVLIHLTLFKSVSIIPDNVFTWVWRVKIHGSDYQNYFNVGTIWHFIHPKCVMPLNASISANFWKFRHEAANLLYAMGYVFDYRMGDHLIRFIKSNQ